MVSDQLHSGPLYFQRQSPRCPLNSGLNGFQSYGHSPSNGEEKNRCPYRVWSSVLQSVAQSLYWLSYPRFIIEIQILICNPVMELLYFDGSEMSFGTLLSPEMWLRVVWQVCAYVSEKRVVSFSEWKCGSLFYAEEGSTFLWNVDIYVPKCTAWHRRRLCCSFHITVRERKFC